MSIAYDLKVLAHILLLVFWLGTDIGVFVSALWVKKLGRPLSERWLLLQLGGALDVPPRLCSALMFPLGVTLARDRWGLAVDGVVVGAFWLIAVIWCGAILTAYIKQGTPIAERIGKLQTAGLIAAGAGAFAWGIVLAYGGSTPPWVALKVALFGFVYWLSVGIDITFRPALQVLAEIPAQGGSPAQEARLRKAINVCCTVVVLLYVVVVTSSALGTLQLPG